MKITWSIRDIFWSVIVAALTMYIFVSHEKTRARSLRFYTPEVGARIEKLGVNGGIVVVAENEKLDLCWLRFANGIVLQGPELVKFNRQLSAGAFPYTFSGDCSKSQVSLMINGEDIRLNLPGLASGVEHRAGYCKAGEVLLFINAINRGHHRDCLVCVARVRCAGESDDYVLAQMMLALRSRFPRSE